MLRRFVLILVCGLALASPSLAGAEPPTTQTGPCQYCGPAVDWTRIGGQGDSGLFFAQYPPWAKHRAFYARTPDQTSSWIKYIQESDRSALEHLDFSKYGVLAFFHVIYAIPELRVAGVNFTEPGGLHLTLAYTSCQPRICAAFAQYVLIRIRKSSLPDPVRQVFVTEVREELSPPPPPPSQAVASSAPLPCGAGPDFPPPCPPPPPPTDVSFNSFGAGLVPLGAPWMRNRVYFAAGIEDTARWFRYVSRADRSKLRQLNFSRFGVFAVFLLSPLPFEEFTVQRMYSQSDALTAEIRVIPFCWHCTGPTPAIPPTGWGSYVLVSMERATLQSPVPTRVYVSELPLPDR